MDCMTEADALFNIILATLLALSGFGMAFWIQRLIKEKENGS